MDRNRENKRGSYEADADNMGELWPEPEQPATEQPAAEQPGQEAGKRPASGESCPKSRLKSLGPGQW